MENSTKKLVSFMKRSGSDEVQVSYLINNPTEEQLTQQGGPQFMRYRHRPLIMQATCSDASLTTSAIARGQTAWDETDIKNDLGLDEV